MEKTQRYCVVLQTLTAPPTIETSIVVGAADTHPQGASVATSSGRVPRRKAGSLASLDRSTTDRARQQGPAVARSGLREDRLEMVLHGVLGHEHQLRDAARIRAADQMLEEFELASAQTARAAEERHALRGRAGFDGDGDARIAALQ